jgi:hypothetical protein
MVPVEAQKAVSEQNGKVSFDINQVPDNLKNDVGVQYLNNIVSAKEVYSYAVDDKASFRVMEVDTKTGEGVNAKKEVYSLSLTDDNDSYVMNTSNQPRGDMREDGTFNKSTHIPASTGHDSEVTISEKGKWAEPYTTKPVSRKSIVLHEMAEAYERTTNHNSYKTAHKIAGDAADTLPCTDERRSDNSGNVSPVHKN